MHVRLRLSKIRKVERLRFLMKRAYDVLPRQSRPLGFFTFPLFVSAVALVIVIGAFTISAAVYAAAQVRETNRQLALQSLTVVETVTEDLSDIVLLEARAVLQGAETPSLVPLRAGTVLERLSGRLQLLLESRGLSVVSVRLIPVDLLHAVELFDEQLRDAKVLRLMEAAETRRGAPEWAGIDSDILLSRAILSVQSLRSEAIVVARFDRSVILDRLAGLSEWTTLAVSWNGQRVISVDGPSSRALSIAPVGPTEGGWTLERTVAVGSILPALRFPLMLSFLAWILSVGAIALVGSVHSRRVRQRIGLLLDRIASIERGELGGLVPVSGTDDIATVSEGFNRMSGRLEEIMENLVQERSRVIAERKAATDARLEALILQIRPHFLFNVLDSINSIAVVQDQPDISRIVTKLGRVMRSLVAGTVLLQPLSLELTFVADLVSLYGLTLGGTIAFRQDIEDDTTAFPVPHLIFQPLVENAIVHGFRDVRDDPVIECTARRHGKEIVVEFWNNGEQLTAGYRDVNSDREDHIGLANVRRRLELTYGQSARLELINKAQGVAATIVFPDTEHS